MLAPELMLTDTPWTELLRDIRHLLNEDADKLKSNREYFKKLYYDSKTDPKKLERFHDSIDKDQLRYDFFSELINRLETLNYKMVLLAIDYCVAKEIEIQGKEPENFQITVRKEGTEFTTYYMVIN